MLAWTDQTQRSNRNRLTRFMSFSPSRSLQFLFFSRWASSITTHRQWSFLSSGQSAMIISKVVISPWNLSTLGMEFPCGRATPREERWDLFGVKLSRKSPPNYSTGMCIPELPAGLCRTSRTGGSSACWSESRDTRWRSCVSMYETLSPSWWWWTEGRWWGRGRGSPCWRSHRETWLTGWSFPGPFHLPGCSFF